MQEYARTLLNGSTLPKHFWAEAVATACYVLNRVSIRPLTKNTPYELFTGRKPNISYFKVFGSKCFILNTKDQLGKFDAKSDEGIFLGYSDRSKAYRVFNKRTNTVEETLHVSFDEIFYQTTSIKNDEEFPDNITESINLENTENNNLNSSDTNELKSPPKILRDHPV